MDEFREWLSDNLRYVALILGILLVLAGAFFGVRAITKTANTPQTENYATDSTDTSGAVETADAAKTTSAGTEGSRQDTVVLITEDGQLTEDAKTSVSTVVNSYYEALNARNTEAVKNITDALSDEDIATIESSQTTYSEISVIPRSGLTGDGKTAVAFADYKYQNPDQTVPHAGLSWLYLQYDENESAYKIVVKASDDPSVKTHVQNLTEDSEIAAVVQKVQEEADAANAAESAAGQGTEATQNTEEASGEDAGQTDAAAAQAAADAAAAQAQAEAAAAEAQAQAEAAAAAQAQAEAALEQAEASGDAEAQAQAEADAAAAAAQAEAAAAAAAEARAQAQAGVGEGDSAVILETCNVRKGAGYEYEVVTVVEEGESVTILEEGQGWVRVRTGNGEGYIGRRFIYGVEND